MSALAPAPPAVGGALQEAARRTLRRMAAAPGRPGAMAPFDSLFADPWRHEQLQAGGRPVVGVLCNFVPEELIYTAGAVPLRLDVAHGAAAAEGGRALAMDLCPEVRAVLGARLCGAPLHRRVDLLICPTACDGKKRLGAAWPGETLTVELPQSKAGPRQQAWWREEVAAVARALERLTGAAMSRRALARAVALYNRRVLLARELIALRCARPGVLGARDAMLVMQATFIADPAWWIEQAEALLKELEPRAAPPPRHRLLLTGSPVLFPEYQLLELLEERGAAVVADDLCSGSERLRHPVVVDEGSRRGLLRALADRSLLPCTCPCFLSGEDRLVRLRELGRACRAQGVVHHTLRLCQPFDLALPSLGAALRAEGLPLLSLHTDFGGEDAPLLRNRVEAFLEMLDPEI